LGDRLHARDGRRIVTRLDPNVQQAAEQAIAAAGATTAGLLRDAVDKAYGRDSDPNNAYHLAAKAVEEVACPNSGDTDSILPGGDVVGAPVATAPVPETLAMPGDPAAPAGTDQTSQESLISRVMAGGNSKP
jgi:hypothetical protein